ncbi:MAG TPA: LacI family DNA-binding transcriptional regulator [Dongiaceae bacterium]|nr:LacI family DNA-binding transcriptional regulator [Dongiaceae bacterium]
MAAKRVTQGDEMSGSGRGTGADTGDNVTIRDIARSAGVSVGTVSRALKNQPGLTEETRRAIQAAADRLGYDRSKLQRSRIRRVAFLLHRQHNTLASSPFFSPILHGVEEACRREGIALSFLSLGPADPIADQLRLHHPDALLCAGFFEAELLSVLRQGGKPITLIDAKARGFTSVNPDHRGGAYRTTCHLVERGCRRIAYLGGWPAHYSIRERAQGYRQALFDHGILADPRLETFFQPGTDLEQGAQEAMQYFLDLPQPPDAVFAFNDSTALIAMHAAQERGLQVPRDIAFVGFDDITAAALSRPPLTTLRIDKEKLGAEGLRLLLQTDPAETTDHILPVELIARESSAIMRPQSPAPKTPDKSDGRGKQEKAAAGRPGHTRRS